MRGDLIEAFKIIRGFVDYGQNLFKLSISGLNILSKITKDTTSDRRDFFSERILKLIMLPKKVAFLQPFGTLLLWHNSIC